MSRNTSSPGWPWLTTAALAGFGVAVVMMVLPGPVDGGARFVLAVGILLATSAVAGRGWVRVRQKAAADRDAARSLAALSAQQAAILDHAFVGIVCLRGREVVWANVRMGEIAGYAVDDLVGRTTDCLHATPEDYESLSAEVRSVLSRGETYQTECELRRRDGKTVWCRMMGRAVPAREARGDSIWIVDDVTERRRARLELARREERLELVFEGTDDGFWDTDVSRGEVFISPRWLSMLGFEPGELPVSLHTWLERIHPRDRMNTMRAVSRHLGGRAERIETEHRLKRKDGDYVWVQVRGKVLARDARGKPLRAAGTYADVSARREREEQLLQAACVFDNASEGVVISGADGVIQTVNKGFTRLTGYPPEEVVGKPTDILNSGPVDPGVMRTMEAQLRATGRWQGEVEGRRKDGGPLYESRTVSTILGPRGEVMNLVTVFSDVTDLRRSRDQVQYLAEHDPLTGVLTRASFSHKVEQCIAAARKDARHVALLVLDVDRLKHVNDTLGRAVADHVLRTVTRRLARSVKGQEQIGRLGGDEFVVLLEDVHRPADAEAAAERIMAAFARPVRVQGHELPMSASLGISLFPGDGDSVTELLQGADMAVDHAKRGGGRGWRFFTAEMAARAAEARLLQSDLGHALERGQLLLHYQPQVDLATGRVVGLEALVRWDRPGYGMVSPAQFIPVAEQSGLIGAIGEWVLRTACAQARTWAERKGPPVQVSVNLSAAQMRRGDLVESVERVLQATGLEPALLELEMTESMVMEDSERTVRTLERLNAMGVSLAIDDFGTGYSSLSYLKRFPIQRLKIDRSFVRDVVSDPNDAAIVSAIVALAGSMGLEVIAEGVESYEQVRFLRDQGCEQGQGYLYAPPQPAANIPRLLDASPRRQA